MLLVASVPVKVLLETLRSPGEVALMLSMGLVCFILSHLVWRLAMRRYSSASS